MNIIKKVFFNLYHLDPTYESLINALKITLPNCAACLIWLYFRIQGGEFFVLYTSFILIVSIYFFSIKDKLVNMVLMFLVLSLFQFFIAIFYQNHFILIIVLFFFCLIVYSSIKHSIVASLSIPWAVCAFALPGGWYDGISTIIQMIIGLIIALFFFLFFDGFFSRIKMRALLVYLASIIGACFDKYLETSSVIDGVLEKRTGKKRLKFIRSVEATIEEMIITRKDRIEYKVSAIMKKADNVLRKEGYCFNFNRKFALMSYQIYNSYKKIFRDLAYLNQMNEQLSLISSEIENFDQLMKNISIRFKNIHLSLKNRDRQLIKEEVNFFHNIDCNELFYDVVDNLFRRKLRLIIYGIVMLEEDLSELEYLLKNKTEYYTLS